MGLNAQGLAPKWRPTCIFPELTGNELFYLTILKFPFGRYFSVRPMTAADAFMIYFNKIIVKASLKLNEEEARCYDGFAREHFCHFIFMDSSRFSDLKNPYMGQSVSKFILNLVKNFDTATSDRRVDHYLLDRSFCPDFGSHRIPYLTPMAAESSEIFRKLQGLSGDLGCEEDQKKRTLYIRSLLYTQENGQLNCKVERRAGSKEPYILLEVKSISEKMSSANVLAMMSNAFNTTLKENEDKDVPEYLFIFALAMEEIEERAEIHDILEERNVVFYQVFLIDGKVRIIPRPVGVHKPESSSLVQPVNQKLHFEFTSLASLESLNQVRVYPCGKKCNL